MSNVLQQKYNTYKQTLDELQSKTSELSRDRDEHAVVLKTLQTTDPERTCYRMIGGALVSTDVATTVPILESKLQNLEKAIDTLKNEFYKTATEFEKWKKDNKIQVVKQ